jgi:hypothetical protein
MEHWKSLGVLALVVVVLWWMFRKGGACCSSCAKADDARVASAAGLRAQSGKGCSPFACGR